MKSKYSVIGLMSGTSLDGLDIVCSDFVNNKGKWIYRILEAETKPYDSRWKERLKSAHQLPALDFQHLDMLYGEYLGRAVISFIKRKGIHRLDFIASHGHTIFHQPQRRLTFQLGDGTTIHNATGLPVVWDFRRRDVLLGGQGAPLVPVGDKLLFGDYEICLNLGGIANVSFDSRRKREAFDVCFVNMGLNYLASKKDKNYDRNGRMGARGKVSADLLKALTNVYSKYTRKARPSLGREFFERYFKKILDSESLSVEDRLVTFCESVANEISLAVPPGTDQKMLITGGGAFNDLLLARISEKVKGRAVPFVPSEHLIKFKEGLVFGFLGVLRVRGEINCLGSVTGAEKDCSSGLMIGF